MIILSQIVAQMNFDWSAILPILTVGGVIIYLLRVKYVPIEVYNKDIEVLKAEIRNAVTDITKLQSDNRVMEANFKHIEKTIEVGFEHLSKEIGHLSNSVKQSSNNFAQAISRSDEVLRRVEALENRHN